AFAAACGSFLSRGLNRVVTGVLAPSFLPGLDLLSVVLRERFQCKAAIKLLVPGFAAIGTMQNDAAVSNRPTLGRAHEIHASQIGLNRNFGLPPRRASVIRINDDTAQTSRYKPLTGFGYGQHR